MVHSLVQSHNPHSHSQQDIPSNTGLIDKHNAWRGGQQTLVQTGDMLDRGPDSLGLVRFFEGLKVTAPRTVMSSLAVCALHLAFPQGVDPAPGWPHICEHLGWPLAKGAS